MLIYLISSAHETERASHIQQLKQQFPKLIQVNAVYPNITKVPFLEKIKSISNAREGRSLSNGEIGCMLSHRNVWQQFLKQNISTECLILESDSLLVDSSLLMDHFKTVHTQFDLFFWGAFDDRMQLLRSTRQEIGKGFGIGKPLVNSLYCTYGYSINKKGAKILLRQTGTFDYPIDYWKRRLKGAGLMVGGVQPNLIKTVATFDSNIRTATKKLGTSLFDLVIDFKNLLISTMK